MPPATLEAPRFTEPAMMPPIGDGVVSVVEVTYLVQRAVTDLPPGLRLVADVSNVFPAARRLSEAQASLGQSIGPAPETPHMPDLVRRYDDKARVSEARTTAYADTPTGGIPPVSEVYIQDGPDEAEVSDRRQMAIRLAELRGAVAAAGDPAKEHTHLVVTRQRAEVHPPQLGPIQRLVAGFAVALLARTESYSRQVISHALANTERSARHVREVIDRRLSHPVGVLVTAAQIARVL